MKEKEYNLDDNLKGFVGREEELEKFNEILKRFVDDWCIYMTESNKHRNAYVLDVFGIGGVGKTTLLKKMRSNVEKINKNVVSIYVDTSGDNSFIDILAKLRQELEYISEKMPGEGLTTSFLAFDLFYKVFYSSYKVKYPLTIWQRVLNQGIKVTQDIFDSVFTEQTIDIDNIKEIISHLGEEGGLGEWQKYLNMLSISNKIAILKIAVKVVEQGVKDIQEDKKREKEVKICDEILSSSLGRMNSEHSRQQLLLELFIKASKSFIQKQAVVFFIDNFRNNADKSEVYRDPTWLISDTGLIKSIPAFFVIGERDELQIGNKQEVKYECINLEGLEYRDIVNYYKEHCELFKSDSLSEVEKKMLAAALIDKQENIGTKVEEDLKKCHYLPIQMMLIAEYYNQVKEEKESKNENAVISVDDLGRIDKLADLCFYFEMNMSEVKRDVFYILSCISIWKEEWFEKVKERFDNYLLTAVHVLGSFSSVENINHGELKLHDLVREKLYESPNNIIKYDVQEWLFLYFLHKQNVKLDENIKFQDNAGKQGIDDLEELSVYVYVCKNYIEGIKNTNYNRFSQEEAISKFVEAFEKSLDIYSSPETVNDEIIGILEFVISSLSSIQPNAKEVGRLIYRLGLLDTYISRNWESLKQSLKGYNEALVECDSLPEKENRTLENYIFRISAKNMAENSLAFDEGSVWKYDEAAKYGTATVKEQYNLICEAKEYLKLSDAEQQAYDVIVKYIDPDNFDNDKASREEFFQHVEIFTKSQYYKKYMPEWNNSNNKDLFVPFTKARGNIPWFYFRIKDKRIRQKYYSPDFDPVTFGWKTYYIRKAFYGDGELTFRSKHNVSVYLAKKGDYENADAISEEVLHEIIDFPLKRLQNLGDKLSDEIIKRKLKNLISLGFFSCDQIYSIYEEYKYLLDYSGLAVEVLQYNSSFKQKIAEKNRDDSKIFSQQMNEAIKKGLGALIIRIITLAENHKEILNSWSYLASYHYYIGAKNKAIEIVKYLLKLYNEGAELPLEKAQEYKMMLQDMEDGIWSEKRRFSDREF